MQNQDIYIGKVERTEQNFFPGKEMLQENTYSIMLNYVEHSLLLATPAVPLFARKNVLTNFSGYFIHFNETFLRQNKHLYTIFFYMPALSLASINCIELVIPVSSRKAIQDLFTKLSAEFRNNHVDSQELISVLLSTLLLYISRIIKTTGNQLHQLKRAPRKGCHRIVDQFTSMIWQKLTFDDSLNDTDDGNFRTVNYYASKLFVHPNHLNLLVKKVTGQTAHEYIAEQLYKFAKMLLLTSDLSIKEISYRLSFYESSHFNKFFKKFAGIPPGEFRKREYSDQWQLGAVG